MQTPIFPPSTPIFSLNSTPRTGHIDTGPYRNENLVGDAIAEAISRGHIASRADLWITGKLPATAMAPAAVEPALRALLAALRTDYVDLYMTHWPYALAPDSTASPPLPEARLGYSAPAYLATWRAMEACVDAGLVRCLGCSNMTAKKLDALLGAARLPPVVVQNEMHTALAQPSLLRFAAARGIVLCGYCPLGSPGRPALYRAPGDPEVLSHPEVAAVAAAVGRTPAQVLLRWAIQRGTGPLPRSTSLARVGENWDVHGWALPEALMARLDALDCTKGSVGRIMKVSGRRGLKCFCFLLFSLARRIAPSLTPHPVAPTVFLSVFRAGRQLCSAQLCGLARGVGRGLFSVIKQQHVIFNPTTPRSLPLHHPSNSATPTPLCTHYLCGESHAAATQRLVPQRLCRSCARAGRPL